MIYNLGRVVPLFKGNYDAATTYGFLDVVFYDNSSFVALDTTTGNLPTDTSHWLPVALKGTTQDPTPEQMATIISTVETYITTNTIVDNLKSTDTDKSLSANQGVEIAKRSQWTQIVGNNGTLVSSDTMYAVNEHTYRIYPDHTNIDVSGVPQRDANTTFFAIISFDYSGANSAELIRINCNKKSDGLQEYYDVVCPQNGVIDVRMMATLGEVVKFKVEDITYSKEIDSQLSDVKENLEKLTLENSTNSSPTNGRLLTNGNIYNSGTAWKYFRYNLDLTKKYKANLSIIKLETNYSYCGVQYFSSDDTFLGYEFPNVGTTNIYNQDFYLNPPEGTSYCRIQTVVYTGYDPSQLWSYEYYDLGSEFATINNSIQYNENLPYTPNFGGGSIDYSNGNTIGTTNSNSGWVNVEGLTSIRYSRFRITSTSNNSGIAFYSSKAVSGYISGQRGIIGASSGGYVDTFISVPPTAKWARFSIWGTSIDYYGGFYVKNGDTGYISYDTINDWISEGIDNADLNVKVLEGKKISIIGDSISCFGTEAQTRNQGYNAPYWIVKTVDVGQQIQSYITWLDVYNTINAGSSLTNKTIGGITLTPSMIGTLQTFTPIAEDVGKCIGVARWASSYTTKPWWQVLIDKSGAELCNNASWSGSRIVEIPVGNSRHDAFVLSESYSEYTTNRVCNRDDEGNTIVPDVILIYRGVNDFVGVDPEGGTGTPDVEDLDTPNLITWDESNFDSHNFTEGYIHTILTLRRKYPNTYIILCTLNVIKRSTTTKFPTDNGTYTLPDYNNKIREIANIMGCGLIEFDKDGITYENCYPTYISDSASAPIHPNTNGHRVMGEKAFADVKYCLQPNNN